MKETEKKAKKQLSASCGVEKKGKKTVGPVTVQLLLETKKTRKGRIRRNESSLLSQVRRKRDRKCQKGHRDTLINSEDRMRVENGLVAKKKFRWHRSID